MTSSSSPVVGAPATGASEWEPQAASKGRATSASAPNGRSIRSMLATVRTASPSPQYFRDIARGDEQQTCRAYVGPYVAGLPTSPRAAWIVRTPGTERSTIHREHLPDDLPRQRERVGCV